MIKSAWIDFYTKKVKKNGKEYDEAVPYIFINDYETVDEEQKQVKEEKNAGNVFTVENLTIDDLDDMPF